jgi:L-fucose isomerase-like protein
MRVKLGYAPTRRDVFSKEDAGAYKTLVATKLRDMDVDFVDIEWLNDEGLLYDPRDCEAVAKKFIDEKVDAVFAPHCNFGTEEAVAKLAKAVGKPLLIWGPRDDMPLESGIRTRDSQCGLFATSKVLQRFRVPFSYIVNCRVDDAEFEDGITKFLGAASVVKVLTGLRVGQIGTRPEGFWSVIVNEGELLEQFGIETVPTTLVEIVGSMESKLRTRSDEVETIVSQFREQADWTEIDTEDIRKMAALKIAIREWADDRGVSAIALQCWNALQDATGIMPCFVNAVLTDEGLPVACETDIHGAVTAAALYAAGMGSSPVFFADLTIRHPQNDNAELLWHCGPFPPSLKAPDATAKVGKHYVLPHHCPGLCEWRVKGGDITIARFDGVDGRYSLAFGEGRGVDGPMTRGTYVYFETDDWPRWEEKFIYGPYIHHVAGIHRKVAAVLEEACRYVPGLTADRL